MESTSFVTDQALLQWVGEFIDKNQLAGSSRKVVCGLSGGADSMLLSHVCEALMNAGHLQSVRHIHIDHGLRLESAKQAFKLKEWAKDWGWNLRVHKITGEIPKSNIEAWARKIRHHLLNSDCQDDEVIFLAHHIDDSFEWFIRQTLGSSQGPLRQGIPLVNKKVRRPFHCLSREQIERFVKRFKLPTLEDPSNKNLRYQRNKIRHQVKAPLLEIFPKGMAHFVERSNQWAEERGLTPKSKESPPKVEEFWWGKNCVSLVMTEQGRWEEVKPQIVETITRLSPKKRGELRQNLAKLFNTLIEGRMRGPLVFSGGIEVAIYPGMLLILNQKGRVKLVEAAKNFKLHLKTSQIPWRSLQKLNKDARTSGIPFVLFRGKTFGLKGLKEDPYFQKVIDLGQEYDLYFRPLRHLEMAATKQGRTTQKIEGFCLSV